jgi:hypothetical protein
VFYFREVCLSPPSFRPFPMLHFLLKRVFATAYILASSVQLSTPVVLSYFILCDLFLEPFDSFISRQSSYTPLRRSSSLRSRNRLFLLPLPPPSPSRLRRSQIHQLVLLCPLVHMLRMPSIHLDRNIAK